MAWSSPLVQKAADFAREAHDGHFRKDAERRPYFVHLESVAQQLAAHGHTDETMLAAAYLHDVFEDRPAWAARLRGEFPALVVSVVDALTEQKLDAAGNRRPKAARFADYVRGLGVDTPVTRLALPVSCSDKLDNARSLVAAEARGDHILDRLSTRPDQHGPQLTHLRGLYAPVVSASLLAAFDAAVADLLALIARR